MTHEMLPLESPPEPAPPEGLAGRLLAEWTRLYAPGRALVLSFGREVPWSDVALVWAAAQDEWDWPAAAIAIDGQQGYQLWWSLEAAVPAARRALALRTLLHTLLPQALPAERLRPVSAAAQAWPGPWTVPAAIPAPQPGGDVWSAFVARDLAPVFEGSPWLDLPPSPEGQADLLARVARIEPRAFEAVLALEHEPEPQPGLGTADPADPGEPAVHATTPAAACASDTQARDAARQFLLAVMQDPQVPMAQRIDAAAVLYRSPGTLGAGHG